MNSTLLPKICLSLVVFAAVNTFLTGIINVDILTTVLGTSSIVVKITDVCIGLSALFVLFQILPNKSLCK